MLCAKVSFTKSGQKTVDVTMIKETALVSIEPAFGQLEEGDSVNLEIVSMTTEKFIASNNS